jgi:hypothetical protein
MLRQLSSALTCGGGAPGWSCLAAIPGDASNIATPIDPKPIVAHARMSVSVPKA